MQSHQLRVIEEKKGLDEKRFALKAFFSTRWFENLDGDEQKRLERQHAIMQEYSNILGERIAYFQKIEGE